MSKSCELFSSMLVWMTEVTIKRRQSQKCQNHTASANSGRRNAWTGPFFIEHEEPQMTLFTMVVRFVGMQSIKLSSDLAFVSNETEEKKKID